MLEALARSLNVSLDLDTVRQAIVAGARDLCGSDIQNDREHPRRSTVADRARGARTRFPPNSSRTRRVDGAQPPPVRFGHH
ncbi:MAG: hypothetical protein WED01_10905, partial [Candidatus Rokuibacteriota bacterium]